MIKTQVYPGLSYVSLLKKVTQWAAKNGRPGPVLAEGRPLSNDPGPMVWCIIIMVQHSASAKEFVVLRTIDEALASSIDITVCDEIDTSLVLTLMDAPSDEERLQAFMGKMKSLGVVKSVPKTFQTRAYLHFKKHALFSEATHVAGT